MSLRLIVDDRCGAKCSDTSQATFLKKLNGRIAVRGVSETRAMRRRLFDGI